MSTQTTNLKLVKPDVNDLYDINVQNSNMDIIDSVVNNHTSNNNNPHGVTAEQVGALPIINAMSTNYDMDAILVSGPHYAWYRTNNVTLGTPFKHGATVFAEAIILSFGSSTTYAIQWAFLSGNTIMTRSMAKGEVSNWTTAFLPLSGGTLTGDLTFTRNTFGGINIKNNTASSETQLRTHTNGASYVRHIKTLDDSTSIVSGLWLYDEFPMIDAIKFEYNEVWYRLFGSHNKPSSTYSGTGVTRTIDTGGIGSTLMIYGSNAHNALVTPHGAMCFYGTTMASYGSDSIKFANGVLTIGTSIPTSNYFNANGVTYTYQVL